MISIAFNRQLNRRTIGPQLEGSGSDEARMASLSLRSD